MIVLIAQHDVLSRTSETSGDDTTRLVDADHKQSPQTSSPDQAASQSHLTEATSQMKTYSSLDQAVYGDKSVRVKYHRCLQTVDKITEQSLKDEACVIACILCFFTGLLWLLFVLSSSYTTAHICHACHVVLRTHNAWCANWMWSDMLQLLKIFSRSCANVAVNTSWITSNNQVYFQGLQLAYRKNILRDLNYFMCIPTKM